MIVSSSALRFSFAIAAVIVAVLEPAYAFDAVKKSRTNICHDINSGFYDRIKTFSPHHSMQDCIDSGGRKYKESSNKPTQAQYKRSDWKHWNDVDNNCRNTRHDALFNASSVPVTFSNSNHCVVVSGRFYDTYSDKYFYKSSDLDYDHIVPLFWAHKSLVRSGITWSKSQKELFANDVANLILVDDELNQIKSAKSPAEWLPPNVNYHCEYVSRFNAIVKKYNLQYEKNEYRKIQSMIQICS